jgi:Bacterial regulatory helix-turn-helix protein, lysR family
MAGFAMNYSMARSNNLGMDLLRAMTTFVRIVDGGSLTAAALALDTSLPTVVRMLAALEGQSRGAPAESHDPGEST